MKTLNNLAIATRKEMIAINHLILIFETDLCAMHFLERLRRMEIVFTITNIL